MALSNPFIVLSYVGGPALLTNATALFIMSTSNHFARAVDRSRFIADQLSGTGTVPLRDCLVAELPEVHRRVLLIGRALVCFYLAAGTFAIATLGSIVGAVFVETLARSLGYVAVGGAAVAGLIGFGCFIAGASLLVAESNTAVRSLSREYSATLALSQHPM
ncbi:MAG TPA: DUF2721 domain-containing protein [Rhizomicrobium sp.]|jgi:hypothetical protein